MVGVLLIVGFIIGYRCMKKKKMITPESGEVLNLQTDQKDWIQIDGRSFPASVVIKYQEFTMKQEIGEGNFGKVYQGHLNLNEVQR